MSKETIVNIIKRNGEVGAEETERYIDVLATTIKEDGLELAQLVCYLDSDELQGYFLDEENNGYWIEFDDMEKATQGKILELEYWTGILEDEKQTVDYTNKVSVSCQIDYIVHTIEQSGKEVVNVQDNITVTLDVNGKKESVQPISVKAGSDSLTVECILTIDGTDTLSYMTYEKDKEYNWKERIIINYIYDSIKTLCKN